MRVLLGYQATVHAVSEPVQVAANGLVDRWQEEAATWSRGLPFTEDSLLYREGLGRTYRRARQLGKKAIRKPSCERMHEWRKWVKYLNYQLELLASGEALERTRRDLTRLGRLLGRHHDLSLVTEMLQGPVSSSHPKAAKRAGKEVRRQERRLERKAERLFHKTLGAPVTEFIRQVRQAGP